MSSPHLALVLVLTGALSSQTTVTLTGVRDNTLWNESNGQLSNGSGEYMFCGVAGFNTPAPIRRCLVAFDVDAVLPAGAVVLDARLELSMSRSSSTTPVRIAVHRVTADWGEGASVAPGRQGTGTSPAPGDATWLHRFYNTAFWTRPGGDFAPAASAARDVAGVGTYTWHTTRLAADVQHWLDTPASDFGWILVSPETTNFTARRFDTHEHPTVANRPRLTVTHAQPPAAAVTGAGCVGSRGVPLALAANGAPALGNGGFALHLSGGPAGAAAFLFPALGRSVPPIPLGPCPIHLDLRSAGTLVAAGLSPLGPVRLDAGGAGTLSFAIPADPVLAGVTVDLQAAASDAGVGGVVTSNALTLIFG